MRVYPHLQDTGGFFIAVLERKGLAKRSASPPVECLIRDKKREADKIDDTMHTKKPRLDPEVVGQMDVVQESRNTELSTSKLASNDGKADPSGGTSVGLKEQIDDDSFKENPYTFLQSDDRILRSCMWVRR